MDKILPHLSHFCSEWLVPLLVAEGLDKEDAHKYQEIFNHQRIFKDIVDSLTRADLKDMGIPIGDIIRMEKAFKKMKIEQ